MVRKQLWKYRILVTGLSLVLVFLLLLILLLN